jgi:hypothetical protein
MDRAAYWRRIVAAVAEQQDALLLSICPAWPSPH